LINVLHLPQTSAGNIKDATATIANFSSIMAHKLCLHISWIISSVILTINLSLKRPNLNKEVYFSRIRKEVINRQLRIKMIIKLSEYRRYHVKFFCLTAVRPQMFRRLVLMVWFENHLFRELLPATDLFY
jgi:hypothetical protein